MVLLLQWEVKNKSIFFKLYSYFISILAEVVDIPVFSCNENEESICGPTCIETCDYKLEFCTKACKYGCFCKDRYVRQSNITGSPCVKREDCDTLPKIPKCCKNQEYSTCGSACPATCDDFSYPLPKPMKACIALCKVGCFCKEGFYRTEKGKCVATEKW